MARRRTPISLSALADIRSWAPPRGGEIDLSAVEQAIVESQRRFHLSEPAYDPHQAALLVQRIRSQGVRAVEIPFAPANLTAMANVLLSSFRERRVDLYRDEQLVQDLLRLNIVQKSYGYRIESPRGGAGGHGDKATAFTLALMRAAEIVKTLPSGEPMVWRGAFARRSETPDYSGSPRRSGTPIFGTGTQLAIEDRPARGFRFR